MTPHRAQPPAAPPLLQRRQFMQAAAATALGAAASGCTAPPPAVQAPARTPGHGRGPAVHTGRGSGHVVVIGGGYGGATAARYIRQWSAQRVHVTLVEPQAAFISCPLSNLVLGSGLPLARVTLPYEHLARQHGVRLVADRAMRIDPARRTVALAGGQTLAYDRLVLSPGIDFMWEMLPGLARPEARQRVPHAWKAGAQTMALRRQLEAMPDGGVFALTIPPAPYRCPPGPYERASLIAHYFRQAKPRAKVLVLDANDDVISKGALFKQIWAERYAGTLEYRPAHALADVDAATGALHFEFHDAVRADVLNVLPPMRAADLAVHTGLATANGRWCEVNWLTHEALAAPHIHVLGDALQTAPLMPKSAHMANQHGKVCAAAIVALLDGHPPNPLPLYNNTCYSFVNSDEAMHVASVHRYDAARQTMLTVPGAGGLSSAASALEGHHAWAWARNIWADTLAVPTA
ncbi:MAG: NAD(P)/FAD-dependent oxidoreductase [Comamonadaceae bacterium]|nr:NAD(P)/FAD-dependent oxidoreductase [Comamonadaceae bacterium]